MTPAPNVTGISPTQGPVGILVTITGTGFNASASDNVVTFNGVSATISSATALQIVAAVPVSATTGVVKVTVNGKDATGPSFTVTTATPVITITSLNPLSGSVGTVVTITGSGFNAVAAQNIVKFNGTPATVTTASATQLVTSVPTGATTGTVTVQVGSNAATGPSFTVTPATSSGPVVTSLAPNTGVVGTAVTINGTGFSTSPSANVVKFNGVIATVATASATALQVTVPVGASTGKVTVGVGGIEAEGPVFTVTTTAGKITVTTLAGDGMLTTLDPTGIAFNVNGDLLIADQFNHRILKYNSSGLSLFAGSGQLAQTGPIDGPFASAQFNGPSGVAVDKSTGVVYVAEEYNNVIRKINPNVVPTYVSTWAGYTNGTADTKDGVGAGPVGSAAASFYSPTSIVKSANHDDWYVTDNRSHIIRKINASAKVTTYAGAAQLTGATNGQGAAARFSFPATLAIDNSDNVYVGDSANDAIRKIDPSGNVTTFATGVGYVFGLACDNKGNVYATSNNKNVIYKIDLSGNKTIIAGSIPGYADGDGSTATFDGPYGIAIDNDGNLIVSDKRNFRLRKITFQ